MKKIYYFVFVFSLSFSAHANLKPYFLKYLNKGAYYTAYEYLKLILVNGNSKISQGQVNRVLDSVHSSVFINDRNLDQLINKQTPLDFAVGLRQFYLGKHLIAKEILQRVPERNAMFLETNYILGVIYYGQKKYKTSISHLRKCAIKAEKKVDERFKPKSYRSIFKNRCLQLAGRVFFELKDYKSSLKYQNFVKVNDYIWPRFLLDKAWNYYHMKDYPRTLGSLLSYNAPIMQRFMIPEAVYLRALGYYDLCYYDKAEKIYDEFNEGFWKYREVLSSYKTGRSILKLLVKKTPPKQKEVRFLYSYVRGFSQDIPFVATKNALKAIKNEMRSLGRSEKRFVLKRLNYILKIVRVHFSKYLVNIVADFDEQIKRTQRYFTKLKLSIGSKRRKLYAKTKSLKFKDNLTNIPLHDLGQLEDKRIWEFIGGFWADELGAYALAIKTQCKG